MNLRISIFLTVFALLTPAAAIQADQLVGDATDLNSGEPLYTEVHTFSERDGQRVMQSQYIAPDQTQLAERQVIYADSQVVSYQLNLMALEYREQIRRSDNLVSFEIDSAAQEIKRGSVEVKTNSDTIIDAGFNDYLLEQWDVLLQGETKRFYFASTARMDLVKLQVSMDSKLSDESMAVFSMTAANPVVRLLIKPVKVGFYRDSKQLAYYQGISNLKGQDGKAYRVEISFENGQMDGQGQLAQQ